jgi:hypothetical protein
MPQPYGFLNHRQQTSMELKASLRLSKHAEAKFDALNTHIRNVVVLPGQLVIVGDETVAARTSEESRLMCAAWDIRHSVMEDAGDIDQELFAHRGDKSIRRNDCENFEDGEAA